MGILPQCLPLVKEHALSDLDQCYLVRCGFFEVEERVGIAPPVAGLPLRPRTLAVPGFENPEQGIVVQPRLIVFRQELVIDLVQFRSVRLCETPGRHPE